MSTTTRRRLKSFAPPRLESLENRQLLSGGPFTSTFRQQLRSFMRANDLPQISIAIQKGEQAYDYSFTNRAFNSGSKNVLPPTTANSLFRLASVSKVFAATVIMKQVELGELSLSDRAFEVLGYFDDKGTPNPQSGYDPVTQQPVTYSASPQLYDVTIQSLLNMSSGLPLSVPVQSATFPPPAGKKDLLSQVIYVQGSYAALALAGKPPYDAPATAEQQVSLYTYSFTTNELELEQPGTYNYSDTGYAVLGAVAQRISQQSHQVDYGTFLQKYILSPVGIQPPQSSPSGFTPMVGIGRTRLSQRYPTEVTYFASGKGPSVFPSRSALSPPFTPSREAPLPYGGRYSVPSHFAEGGLVANPLALVRLFNRLDAVYRGKRHDGPLSRDTITQMVSFANGVPVGKNGSWWGLGWQVYPVSGQATTPGNWVKNGGLPGTTSLLVQLGDGTTFAYTLNKRVSKKGTDKQPPPTQQLATLVRSAIKAWNSGSATVDGSNWSR